MKLKAWAVAVCVCTLLMVSSASFCSAVDEGQARSAMTEADHTIKDCYLAVAAADKAGGNVSSMLLILQNAGMSLSKAESAFEKNDYDQAYNLAVQSKTSLEGFVAEANLLKDTAEHNNSVGFWVYIVGSSVGTVAVVAGSFAVWLWLNKRYNRARKVKPDGSEGI